VRRLVRGDCELIEAWLSFTVFNRRSPAGSTTTDNFYVLHILPSANDSHLSTHVFELLILFITWQSFSSLPKRHALGAIFDFIIVDCSITHLSPYFSIPGTVTGGVYASESNVCSLNHSPIDHVSFFTRASKRHQRNCMVRRCIYTSCHSGLPLKSTFESFLVSHFRFSCTIKVCIASVIFPFFIPSGVFFASQPVSSADFIIVIAIVTTIIKPWGCNTTRTWAAAFLYRHT
jgi:hypothetical protein